MRLFRRPKRLLAGVVIATLTLAGIATAYWTQSGSGTGSGQTGTTNSIVVNQTSTVNGLFPGGSQALSGDFTNSNGGNVYVSTVTAVVAPFSAQADLSKPACTAGDFAISGTAPVNLEIPPGTNVGSWSGLSIAMIDSSTNQDNCKNITVPINYTSN